MDKILLTKPGLLYQEMFSAKQGKNIVTSSHPSLLAVSITYKKKALSKWSSKLSLLGISSCSRERKAAGHWRLCKNNIKLKLNMACKVGIVCIEDANNNDDVNNSLFLLEGFDYSLKRNLKRAEWYWHSGELRSEVSTPSYTHNNN